MKPHGVNLSAAFAVVACSFLGALLSCGEDPLGPPPVEYDYFPFLPGMKWVYEMSGEGHTDDLGNYTLSGSWTVRFGSATTHSLGFTVYPRYNAWHTVRSPIGSGDIEVTTGSDTDYIHATDLEIRVYNGLEDSTYFNELEYPLEIGSSWPYYTGSVLQVTSLTASVTTPFDDFNDCAEITATNPSYPESYSHLYYDAVYGKVSHSGYYEEPTIPGHWEDYSLDLDEFTY